MGAGELESLPLAGVRTGIMSLWPVDDEATREWMDALYEAHLDRKLPTAESMREAGRAIPKKRRAAGRSTHPFHWASFVASGDWR